MRFGGGGRFYYYRGLSETEHLERPTFRAMLLEQLSKTFSLNLCVSDVLVQCFWWVDGTFLVNVFGSDCFTVVSRFNVQSAVWRSGSDSILPRTSEEEKQVDQERLADSIVATKQDASVTDA